MSSAARKRIQDIASSVMEEAHGEVERRHVLREGAHGTAGARRSPRWRARSRARRRRRLRVAPNRRRSHASTIRERSKLSRRMSFAPASSASRSCSSVSTSTCSMVPSGTLCRSTRTAPASTPAARDVVFLDEHAVVETQAVVHPCRRWPLRISAPCAVPAASFGCRGFARAFPRSRGRTAACAWPRPRATARN